ncbi:MAG TPA: methyltransferase domain-containing protein [Methanococcaceae archaeon]|uniref:Methyltransferase domain-containing protein n=1 Tax=Methanothermococcus okinawensis TaxID=155863 RepID=A0A832ZKU7_9EURY|nr:methyltransferase domain-containing protein [Methanococcaceae archaeon]HIP90711.1 methyltransferase domain-containing protein [Methanothermococcus okinawensis]
MKKKYLEIVLDNLNPHPRPKPHLEQYTIGGKLASELLFSAWEDIRDNLVVDLGCGTGRLSIGAKLLGAGKVLGIDIDRETLECARENLKKLERIPVLKNLGVDLEEILKNVFFVEMDVKDIDRGYIGRYLEEGMKVVVIQNPPFGAQRKHADRIFLEKALEIGDVVYTIHNSATRDFVINYVKEKGRNITYIFETKFRIPRIYSFHTKRYVDIPVDIYRIE